MKTYVLTLFLIILYIGVGFAFPQDRSDKPDSYGKQPQGYFQYVNVPGKKEYEFGWNRGNPEHYVSRYEQSKDHRFRTRVRWGDNIGGYGEHYWEYNHGGKKDESPSYEPPVYSPPPQPYSSSS